MATHSTARRPKAADFISEVSLETPLAHALDLVSTREGVAAWWTPVICGPVAPRKDFELGFRGLDEVIRIHFEFARRPNTVTWIIKEHSGMPEWNGTWLTFSFRKAGARQTTLHFRHHGLHPGLTCYADCEAGWHHFLTSLAEVAAGREGQPYGN